MFPFALNSRPGMDSDLPGFQFRKDLNGEDNRGIVSKNYNPKKEEKTYVFYKYIIKKIFLNYQKYKIVLTEGLKLKFY